MSIVYKIYPVIQRTFWRCWIYTPTAIQANSLSSGIFNAQYNLNTSLLTQSSDQALNDAVTKALSNSQTEGLNPMLLNKCYVELGFSIVKSAYLNNMDMKNDQQIADLMEAFLKKYGPLIHIRKALGHDNAIHTEPLIGIVRGAKTRQTPSGITYIYHDTMTGQESQRDALEFRELITVYKYGNHLIFWHYKKFENNTKVIMTKTDEYSYIDKYSVGMSQKNLLITAGLVAGLGIFSAYQFGLFSSSENNEIQLPQKNNKYY